MEPVTSDRRRFEVLRCLGAGGFGEVYLANMVSAGGVRAEVALKVLHQGLDPRSQAIQRLKDEARLLGLLNHPAILRIHDLVLLEGRVTLVTEYVAGADLDRCLAEDDPIELRAVLEVIGKVADALQDAWARRGPGGEPLRLLHRDIKPSNIRIGRHGEVKLLDFGIAKAAGMDREAKTQTDTILGSFPYMAPERFDAAGDDPAGDVYSLGCTLFEAIAGERLVDLEMRQLYGLAMVEGKHRAHMTERLGRVTHAPARVIELLRAMLAFDSGARPPLEGLGLRCEDLAAELGGRTLSRWARQHPWRDADDVTGALSGRTITESAISVARSGGISLPPEVDLDGLEVARSRKDPPRTGVVAPGTLPSTGERPRARLAAPEANAPAVVPPPAPPAPAREPERAAEPARAAATREVPAASPKRRGAWLALGGLGAATVAAMALAAVALTVVVVLGLGLLGPDVADGDVPEVEPALTEDPVAAALGSEPSQEPGAEGSTEPGAAHASAPGDAAADAGGQPEPTPEVASAKEASLDMCGDPISLEPPALLGQLPVAARACLADAIRRTDMSQVDRVKLGRILIVDAKSRCDQGGACADYEREQLAFFESVDRSDADMLFTFASYLGAAAPPRHRDTRTWVARALERKQAWSGPTYVKRVDTLLELDARAAYALWETSGGAEKPRLEARNAASEWMNYRIQLGRDSAPALALCASAAGSEEACKARTHDQKAIATVTFVTVPVGGTVTVDGTTIGTAPTTPQLSHGEHEVTVTVGDATATRKIVVGVDQPTRWIWRASSDEWQSAF